MESIRKQADRLRFDFRHPYTGTKPMIFPTRLKLANSFVDVHHRHTGRTSRDGGRYAMALVCSGLIRGVAITGNPLSATLMDGVTAEILRLCLDPDYQISNAPSMMYSASWRAWRAMGGLRMVTYTLKEEPGTSLKASGFKPVATTKPSSAAWASKSKSDGIERTDTAVLHLEKVRWEIQDKDYQTVLQSFVGLDRSGFSGEITPVFGGIPAVQKPKDTLEDFFGVGA